jgi:hypothetical protein
MDSNEWSREVNEMAAKEDKWKMKMEKEQINFSGFLIFGQGCRGRSDMRGGEWGAVELDLGREF